jgi:hypothetical protein
VLGSSSAHSRLVPVSSSTSILWMAVAPLCVADLVLLHLRL